LQRLPADTFERFERVIPRLPQNPKELEPIVWPWTAQNISATTLASTLPRCLGDRSPKRLLPYLRIMDSWVCHQAIQQIGQLPASEWEEEVRATLFSLIADTDAYVRLSAQKALAHCVVTPDEAAVMEKLLTRKTADVRLAALGLLLNQPDDAALASADHL